MSYDDTYDSGEFVDELAGYINLDQSLRVVVNRHDTQTVFDLVDMPANITLYSVLKSPMSDAECRELAQRMMYQQRPHHPRELDDDRALDRIAALLRQPDLDIADFADAVAHILNLSGRRVGRT